MNSVRRRGGAVRVSLDNDDVVLLAGLLAQVKQMLGGDGSVSEDPLDALLALPPTALDAPKDPILARLLPDAYRDDEAAAGEFRRLMDGELRAEKAAALQRVIDDLAAAGTPTGKELRLTLTDEAASQWLYALNDARLVLGTMLEVDEDGDWERASLDPDSPRSVFFGIYNWLTWLQGAMVEAVAAGG